MKSCRKKDCKQSNPQPLSNFVKDVRYADGYQNRCKSCQKEYDAKRFEQKREDILADSRTYYAANLQTARKKRADWRVNNKKYMAEYGKMYRAMFPKKELAKTRRYQLAKINALPSWLTVEQIKEMTKIYENCPSGHEVDHIVPLQGKQVNGLHVPWNLQYLTIEENRRKSNKY